MFILVQGLSTLDWIELFARWWAAWVACTGVLGAVGGMGLLSYLFCNESGRGERRRERCRGRAGGTQRRRVCAVSASSPPRVQGSWGAPRGC